MDLAYCPTCRSVLPGISPFADGPLRCGACGATFHQALAQPAASPVHGAGIPPMNNPYAPPMGYPAPPPGLPWNYGFMTPELYAQGYQNARGAMLGPAISLGAAGLIFALGGLGMAVWSVPLVQTEPEPATGIIVGVVGVLSLFCGVYFLYAAWLLKSLRSQQFVMVSTIVLLILSVLTCIPMAAFAIWPMIAVNRTETRMYFDRPPQDKK